MSKYSTRFELSNFKNSLSSAESGCMDSNIRHIPAFVVPSRPAQSGNDVSRHALSRIGVAHKPLFAVIAVCRMTVRIACFHVKHLAAFSGHAHGHNPMQRGRRRAQTAALLPHGHGGEGAQSCYLFVNFFVAPSRPAPAFPPKETILLNAAQAT